MTWTHLQDPHISTVTWSAAGASEAARRAPSRRGDAGPSGARPRRALLARAWGWDRHVRTSAWDVLGQASGRVPWPVVGPCIA